MRDRLRFAVVFAVLGIGLAALILASICIGNVQIPLDQTLQILSGKEADAYAANIIWKIRLPRLVMAGILGGALALAGFLLQTFFRNPIAGPFVLGISSGAKLFVSLVMVFLLGSLGGVSSTALILAAFAGSLLVTGFILLISRVVRNMAALLVGGIMAGYICSALTDFVVTFAEDSDIVNLHGWSQGSFSGMNWGNVRVAAIVIAISFVLTMLLAKPIGAYLMGERYAQSIGVNVRHLAAALILLSSLLSATVTAFAGPVSFVGIAVPFLIRRALGTARPLIVMPASFLGGAVFCMFCDLIARTVFAPVELNISTVTAIFGAPVVIFMLIMRSAGRQE